MGEIFSVQLHHQESLHGFYLFIIGNILRTGFQSFLELFLGNTWLGLKVDELGAILLLVEMSRACSHFFLILKNLINLIFFKVEYCLMRWQVYSTRGLRAKFLFEIDFRDALYVSELREKFLLFSLFLLRFVSGLYTAQAKKRNNSEHNFDIDVDNDEKGEKDTNSNN